MYCMLLRTIRNSYSCLFIMALGNNASPCASNPCVNGGICVDGIDLFTCTCVGGFRGGATCDVGKSNYIFYSRVHHKYLLDTLAPKTLS